jgi:hypothetical protein
VFFKPLDALYDVIKFGAGARLVVMERSNIAFD